MLHPFASMDITGMHRMPARLTATMDQIGSTGASSLELDRGSAGSVEDTGAAVDIMDAAASADEPALVHADLKGAAEPDSLEEAGMPVARR